MKIYKYASMEKALEILKTNRLLLNNPKDFNDPFDNNLKRDKDDVIAVRKIMEDYTMATLSVQLIMDPLIANRIKNDPRFKLLKADHDTMIETLKSYPRFKSDYGMRSYYDFLGITKETFQTLVNRNLKKFEEITAHSIEQTKKDVLVTCFSKVPDSILMWSHYAKSHTGVCIEYERPNNNLFIDITYSRKRPKIKLEEMISFMCAQSIVGKQYNRMLDSTLVFETTRPFLTKSLDWEYEQEVRCAIMASSNYRNHIIEGDKHYFVMPKPTKIYIGCKAKGKEMDNLIAFAKKNNIKFVFLRCDEDTFLLKEK